MLTTARRAGDPVEVALSRIADRGVAVEPWIDAHQAGATVDRPVLYLVAAGAEPPAAWSELEDWVRLPVSPDELYARADRLLARALEVGAVPMSVDDDDVLHVGQDRIPLSLLEARMMRLLLEHRGDVVSRETASAAMWPDGQPDDPRAVDNRLKNLRQRLAGSPLRIQTVRSRGFVLEWDRTRAEGRRSLDSVPEAE